MPNKKTAPTTEQIFVRPPIVTIMGHVDHGKTSLLDYIRKTQVAAKEYGGITQSIGAYQASHNGKRITFIDTPGHAAFTQMRIRGSKAADIVVLVVSADDGVMPQTKEAISHTQASQTPMIVAINKIDVAGVDANKIKQQLAESEVLVEGYGGDVISCEVSAKTGQGIDKLLDSILALSEILELKADPEGELEGVVIEAKLDSKRGPTFTGIVKNGTLKAGEEIFTTEVSGKVRALFSFDGSTVKEAYPSDPVEVTGFSKVPSAGDIFVEEKNKSLLDLRAKEHVVAEVYGEGVKVVNLILRADSTGSLEALEGALRKLESDEGKLKFLLRATGDLSESDVLLAHSSKGIILGFNSKIPAKVAELAESHKVQIRTYKIIYELLDDVENVLKDALFKEEVKVKGLAKVLRVFPLESGDVVAGSVVLGGVLRPGVKVEVKREGVEEVLYTGKVKELRRNKDIVNVVGKDVECGVFLNPNFKEIKTGDLINVL